MIPAGAENGVGIFTASYLKDPTDPQFQKGKEWDDFVAFMKKYMASADIKDVNHTYGYTVAQGLVQRRSGNRSLLVTAAGHHFLRHHFDLVL